MDDKGKAERRLTWTEAGGGLGCSVDGNGEGVAGANHLLCGGDAEDVFISTATMGQLWAYVN